MKKIYIFQKSFNQTGEFVPEFRIKCSMFSDFLQLFTIRNLGENMLIINIWCFCKLLNDCIHKYTLFYFYTKLLSDKNSNNKLFY